MSDLAAPMTGDGCSALPFSEDHRAALKAACAEETDVWKIHSSSFAPEYFDLSLNGWLSRPDLQLFALFEDGELAGMSAFLAIEPDRGVVEIGGTYYRPHHRGTGLNRRVKDMMLRRAFACGYRRIEFRVDARNARSQAAMAKLGATREGVLRADRITWNGHVRDTVLFSILRDEWMGEGGG
nr:GNAT family protein [uncultured Sphingomonas sp.]